MLAEIGFRVKFCKPGSELSFLLLICDTKKGESILMHMLKTAVIALFLQKVNKQN